MTAVSSNDRTNLWGFLKSPAQVLHWSPQSTHTFLFKENVIQQLILSDIFLGDIVMGNTRCGWINVEKALAARTHSGCRNRSNLEVRNNLLKTAVQGQVRVLETVEKVWTFFFCAWPLPHTMHYYCGFSRYLASVFITALHGLKPD